MCLYAHDIFGIPVHQSNLSNIAHPQAIQDAQERIRRTVSLALGDTAATGDLLFSVGSAIRQGWVNKKLCTKKKYIIYSNIYRYIYK